jgi:DNA-binding NarL/FixJ family response regulator
MKTEATLVIIEDEPVLRENMVEMLTLEGFRAHGAADGRQGLALVRRERPEMIVCDISMPELDGYAVLDAVRADLALAGVVFLFLTAKGAPEDLRLGMNLGADDYLHKPVKFPELLVAIRARLARRAEQRRAALSPAGLESLNLSPREAEILFWVAQGKTNPEIAIILGIGRATVKTHLDHILVKTDSSNRLGAAALATAWLAGSGRR